MRSAALRRVARLVLPTLATGAGALALAVPATGAGPPRTEPLTPYVIGGSEASISQFPWQVLVLLIADEGGIETEASCGGSILDSTHILTAAHCVDHEGTTATYPAADFVVVAGASDVSSVIDLLELPPGAQAREPSSIRTHPYYALTPEIKDDVAVLTLSSPLELSPAANAQAIGLVPEGATPTPGTPLTISGYGKENGAEGSEPTGQLFSTTLTAIGSDACREEVGVNSAVLLCAQGASSSTCQGDSGGPLTEGNPPVEVGTVDFGLRECPVGRPDAFTNLAAPEVRAFIEGSESPPVAARPLSPPLIESAAAIPVDLSPLTCVPGAWSESPSFSYTFQVESASATVLQSAPANSLIPPSSLVGSPLVCVVQASNAGGVSTLRSGVTPALVADTAPPVSQLLGSPRCHLQACTLAIRASDPNAVALSVQASAAYRVLSRCPARRKKHSKPAKPPVCHKTKTVTMRLANPSVGSYVASASRLPYGERIQFRVLATNAAGIRQSTATLAAVTLNKPKHRPKGRRRRR